jgi:hypothetical protein
MISPTQPASFRCSATRDQPHASSGSSIRYPTTFPLIDINSRQGNILLLFLNLCSRPSKNASRQNCCFIHFNPYCAVNYRDGAVKLSGLNNSKSFRNLLRYSFHNETHFLTAPEFLKHATTERGMMFSSHNQTQRPYTSHGVNVQIYLHIGSVWCSYIRRESSIYWRRKNKYTYVISVLHCP